MTAENSRQLVEKQHDWLSVGAVAKADSVIELTNGREISSVIEIGSGTGALLQNLDTRGFGERYFAVEPSRLLFDFMMDEVRPSRFEMGEASLFEESSLRSKHYDLAILSHVLEHLEAPAPLLGQALDVADYVVVEVPLEGTTLGNLRAKSKSVAKRKPRTDNAAGHIQFFSQHSIEDLVRWSGGDIIATRLYFPTAAYAHNNAVKGLPQKAVQTTSLIMNKHFPTLWAKYYYGHYALLVQSTTKSSNRRNVDHPLYHHP